MKKIFTFLIITVFQFVILSASDVRMFTVIGGDNEIEEFMYSETLKFSDGFEVSNNKYSDIINVLEKDGYEKFNEQIINRYSEHWKEWQEVFRITKNRCVVKNEMVLTTIYDEKDIPMEITFHSIRIFAKIGNIIKIFNYDNFFRVEEIELNKKKNRK